MNSNVAEEIFCIETPSYPAAPKELESITNNAKVQ